MSGLVDNFRLVTSSALWQDYTLDDNSNWKAWKKNMDKLGTFTLKEWQRGDLCRFFLYFPYTTGLDVKQNQESPKSMDKSHSANQTSMKSFLLLAKGLRERNSKRGLMEECHPQLYKLGCWSVQSSGSRAVKA